MTNQNSTYDWMLVTVRGYDTEKGYIFGNRHPDGKGVIIAKKHTVQRDWIKSLSSEKERTYTPPQSVIAVFGAEEKDHKSGFTIASWASPVSKDFGQEDVFVTPIKIGSKPKNIKNAKPGEKNTFIDAIVLDSNATEVRTLEDLQASAVSLTDKNSKTALQLDGSRGFMIRIGHTAPDGSLEASSWEFLGRKSNTPEQTWNFHWNQKPQQGRKHNLIQAVLTAAKSAFNDPNSYVEVAGCTRTLINDFGNQKRVEELSSLPNYKTSHQGNIFPTYSLAAITVEKHGNNRIIKQQIPLPRNKVINHLAGVLGNHIPGRRMPVAIQPILASEGKLEANITTPLLTGSFPLSISDYVNEHGEVRSFRVTGTKQAIDKYQVQIEQAVPGIRPFRVRGEIGYSFPLRYRKEVESVLSDIAGTPALFVSSMKVNQVPYIKVSGKVDDPRFKDSISKIHSQMGASLIDGQSLIAESKRSDLVSAVNSLMTINGQEAYQPVSTESNNIVTNDKNVTIKESNSTPTVSFSDWQQAKFGKDPYAMLDFLDGEVNAFAEEAGIDWASAKSVVAFGAPNTRGKLVKSREVRPLNKSHTGSVAMAAHLHEKLGTEPGNSILWFKVNFFNKKVLKDDVVTFDSYTALKEEYDRDVQNGIKPSEFKADLEAIKSKNVERQKEAMQKIAQQTKEDLDSRNYWARKIPTMPRENGTNQYFADKGIIGLLNKIDAHSGEDNQGRFTILPLHDMNQNFMGAQRIYENYWEDNKGKRTNKNFIRGTLFKDDLTNLPYGTHYLVGEINPTKPIVFCEGVADSGTDHTATGLPTVICLNKGNLYHVVGLYRQRYPNTRLIIASDNDFYNKQKGNVGLSAALDASRDHNAEYVVPSFKGLNTDDKPTDFNDLEKIAGLDVVRNQFQNIRVVPADALDFHKLKVQVVGTNDLEKYINNAVSEIIGGGNHGLNEDRILQGLLTKAELAYGREDVMRIFGEKVNKKKITLSEDITEKLSDKNDSKFPVEIKERTGANGKKYALICDHSGGNAAKIERSLKQVLGDKHFPFNAHLNGWVAPYPVTRLLNSILFDVTGASQLYIGQSRSKNTGSHFVVRGDFNDEAFKTKIEKAIKYAKPQFKKSEYGFVIPDSRAVPYIKETLRSFLASNHDLKLSIPKVEVPQVNQNQLEEAVRISGQGRGEIVLAHYALLFKDSHNIFIDTDFAFSGIYSRSIKSFTHLEPDVRHQKALEDAFRSTKLMLDTGVGKTVASDETLQRLNELITHLDFVLTNYESDDKTLGSLSEIERNALEHTALKFNIEANTVNTIIQGLLDQTNSSNRESILREYQNKLTELVAESVAKVTPSLELGTEAKSEAISNSIDNKATDVSSEKVDNKHLINEDQLNRISKLLEIVHLVVDKGFDEEDLYDIFITQAGSPYYELSNDTFNDVLYRQDMRILSTSDQIPNWQPTRINTTSQLYYAIYTDVAKQRLTELENYIGAYFGQNGVTTYKTFNKYFSGKQEFATELTHPYIMEGEINHDLITQDLEHQTEFVSIHEFYRAISADFERAQDTKQEQQDIFSIDNSIQQPKPIHGDVISETAENNHRAKITEYLVSGQSVYEFIVDDYKEGSWSRNYHSFNLNKETALAQIEHIKELKQSNQTIDANLLPGGTKGSVSISTVARETGNGLTLEHNEVDTGPSSFYVVSEKHVEAGIKTVIDHGIYDNFLESTNAFQNLYSNLKNEIRTLVEIDEPQVNSKSSESLTSVPSDLGERFSEWARKGETFEQVIDYLTSQYQMKFTDENLSDVKDHYNKLIIKITSDSQIKNSSPDENYNLLYEQSVRLASNELIYDEYIEELFKPDGQFVKNNPYWDAKTQEIDRKSAFLDIKKAGYQSLSEFYDSIFKAIHHRSSSDLLIRRTGGYIPSSIDTFQPIRPQFENLEQLFRTDGIEIKAPEYLPPFDEWVLSDNAYRVIHPIFTEDLTQISADELAVKYSKDAMLMFADIHGVSLTSEMSKEEISNRISSQWKTRTLLSSMDRSELNDLNENELTDFLSELSLPISGKHQDKSNRILGHIEQLRSISKLRLAQYSYINSAILLDQSERTLPNYVFRGISEFISNETAFKDSADRAIENVSTAQLRKNIDIAVNLLTGISPIERTILNASEQSTMKVVGIDQDKETAIVFSDNYDRAKASGNRYSFKYVLPKSMTTSSQLNLPGHITHHGVFNDRTIGTASPIDSNFLLAHGFRPISSDSMMAVAAPLERWMDKFGYAGFTDGESKTIVALKEGNKWTLSELDEKSIELSSEFTNTQKLLQKVVSNIQGFSDRDVLVEEWLSNGLSKSTIDRLQLTIDTLTDLPIADTLIKNLESDQYEKYIGDHKDEHASVKIELIARGLLQDIRQQAWVELISKEKPNPNLVKVALDFMDSITVDIQNSKEIKNDVDIENFYALTPIEASHLYELYISSEKTDYSEIFESLTSSYYDSLSQKEKHIIAVDLASGAYENLGHFLHESDLKNALSLGKSEATKIAEQFYSEIEIDIVDNSNVLQKNEIEPDDFTILIYPDSTFEFAKVVGIDGNQYTCQKASQGKLVDPSINQSLYSEDGTYLPSLSVVEFSNYPESRVAPNTYLDIDPRTDNGKQSLQKLKLYELSDYAFVIGASHTGDRIQIINSIDEFIFIKSKIKELEMNSENLLSTEEMNRISNYLGDPNSSKNLLNTLVEWADNKNKHTILELSKRNLENITIEAGKELNSLSAMVVDPTSSFTIDSSMVKPIRINGLADIKSVLNEINSLKDIADWLESGSDDQLVNAYTCLDQLALTPSRLIEDIGKIPPSFNIVPNIVGENIKWDIVSNNTSIQQYNSPSLAIDAARTMVPENVEKPQEGDLVAWMEDNDVNMAHISDHSSLLTGKLTATFTDKHGRNYLSELESGNFITLNEEALNNEFKGLLAGLSGDKSEITVALNDLIDAIRNQGDLSNIVKGHYFKLLVEEHIQEISKYEALIPEGFIIEQRKNEFALKVLDSDNALALNLTDTFESPSELARNTVIQQRIITEKADINENIRNNSSLAESVGINNQESLRNDATDIQQQAENEERVDDDVTQIPTKNRRVDGNDDDSPDDPTPDSRNKRIRDDSSLSSENPIRSPRNSSSTSSPRTRGVGYQLSDELESEVSGGYEKRLRLNLDALKIRREIVDTGRAITNEDREQLSKYTGWGGLSNIFSSHSGYNSNRTELFRHLQTGEYDELKRSVLTAFYTPPSITKAMWSAIEHFGFDGGKILDPSTGTGQYLGCAPNNITQNSSFIGKEIEPVSANIAQYIYGKDCIHNEPYEKAKLPHNYFDLAISNIPFGDIKVFDSEYKKHNFRIHDYFFSKSLDKVKPGGIVAFITTTGTLDRKDPTVRQHLYEQADLVGAIRLPRKTFKDYAGTDVSADMIFLQKRMPGQQPKEDNWLWSINHEFKALGHQSDFEELSINRYFLDNPEMVIGEMLAVNGRHGPELVTSYNGDISISDEIRNRVNHLPNSIMTTVFEQYNSSTNNNEQQEPTQITNDHLVKPGSFVVFEGRIGIIEPVFIEDTASYKNTIIPANIGDKDIHRLTSIIAIRDTTKETINIQLGTFADEDLQQLQRKLNQQYDQFVSSYDCLNSTKNKRLFSSDPDSALILALENLNKATGVYEKTDIFTKATIRNNSIPDHAETVSDALNISLGVKGQVDPQYISELIGKNWNDVISELDDSIYLDPNSNRWQPKEQYLSGNIKEKLDFAREAALFDSQFDKNIKGLESVLPDPIPAYDIKVRLGATWIPVNIISKFIRHIIAGDKENNRDLSNFSVSQHAAAWVVKVDPWELSRNEGRVSQEWGTKRLGAHEIIDKLLNNRQITIKDRLDDGTYLINRDETIAVNQKADTIGQEFRDWIWSNPEQSTQLESLYNDRYNVYVEPKYTGNSVRLDGISPELKGRPLEARDSQKAAIQRYILEGRSLNAHPVGAGKTLEIVGSAMEGKRLGVHKKPLIVVPNNILSQFGRMALELFPGANTLVIDPKQLSKNARKLFTARIATSNWDMVVIAQSSFDKIATPIEHQKAIINEERYQLQEALQELSSTDNRAAQLTVKRLERALDALETKIESLTDSDKKDNFLYLNEIGVDALFVDEADNYLNLYTPTQMGHVPGVNTSASQRAMNMFMAVRYIQNLNGNNRGVIFATGTDIRNSMSDMYTMLRYLGPDILESSGAINFDSFMGTFGEVVKTIEVNPEGTGYRENSRLSKFTNIPEMVLMYRQVADILTDKQLQLPKPKVEEINVAAESGRWLAMYMAYLANRAQATRTGSVDNRDDNLLKIASDGRKASLDMRLVDSRIPDDPKSKVNECVRNLLKEWESGQEKKLTQIVFCDMGVSKKGIFNIYDDIKNKLIASGVPEKEIAFSQDYKTDSKKKELESSLNNGDIRIVIASTETLGVGSNIQEKLVAQHNLDAPWRPRDLEQRGGRMERPGNSNETTRRYNYAQTDSFDLFMWETLKRKAAFIQQAKVDPRSAAREIDEDLNPTYSELMAITTGNPLIRRKIEIDSNVEKLQSAERSHKRSQWDNTYQIRSHETHTDYSNESIRSNNELQKLYQQENSSLKIGNIIFTDPKKAASAINAIVKQKTEISAYKSVHTIPLGEIGKLPFQLTYMPVAGKWIMQTDTEKPKTISEHKSVRAMVDSLLDFSNELQREINRSSRDIERHEEAIESLKEAATKPFKHKEELDQLLVAQRDINTELSNMANEEISVQQNKAEDFEQELNSIPTHAPIMRVG